MKVIGIIPSRYSSTRFPGKSLADLGGKPVIQWVYERSAAALREVWVATDDERIFTCVKNFGGKVVMTGVEHKSGTDRCAEALEIIEEQTLEKFDIVINIQGDEPFIDAEQIRQLAGLFDDEKTEISTLTRQITDPEDIFDPNKPKLVTDHDHFALLFSRSPIPYLRGVERDRWFDSYTYFKHIGVYGYRVDVLRKITSLIPSGLEMAESLEQLRWLENGYRIKVGITTIENMGIDTPEDLERARSFLLSNSDSNNSRKD